MSGDGQVWNPESYEKNARFVSELGMPVIELLAPRPGERILDLGCGDGVLTKKLADMGCDVVCVDTSPQFVEAARKLGLDARLRDGQRLTFKNEFDAVVSNAALHWMKKHPEDVVKGVRRALKKGGRFAAEFGGQGNVASIAEAIDEALKARGIDPAPLNPWYFPSSAEYSALLEKNGFTIRQIELFQRPTHLPADITGWLETFAGDFTAAVPVSDRAGFLEDVKARLRPKLYHTEQNKWIADYVRLRFLAVAA